MQPLMVFSPFCFPVLAWLPAAVELCVPAAPVVSGVEEPCVVPIEPELCDPVLCDPLLCDPYAPWELELPEEVLCGLVLCDVLEEL